MKKQTSSSCSGGLLYAAMVVATPALIAGGLFFGNQRLQIIGWILLLIVALPTIFRHKQNEQKLDVSELSDLAIDGKFKPNASTRAFIRSILERLEEIDATENTEANLVSLQTDLESMLNPKDFR